MNTGNVAPTAEILRQDKADLAVLPTQTEENTLLQPMKLFRLMRNPAANLNVKPNLLHPKCMRRLHRLDERM
jgi:hypothetical protein